ncbi:MAG: hypothetical protein ABR535_07950 [Pyrinomonadaceae bacterium]
MDELDNFYNEGFGWVCRHCSLELEEANPKDGRSRLLAEGEAESKLPDFSTTALAKWADPARRTLICPHCGVTELADKS